MTVIHTVSPRTSGIRRTAAVLGQGPRYGRDSLVRSRRPAHRGRPGAPTRYYGTGVAMSVAPHRRRPVTMATTVGLALLAGVITLWLGLVANFGQLANGESGGLGCPCSRPARRRAGGAGESLQDVGCSGWRRTRRPARSPTASANSTI